MKMQPMTRRRLLAGLGPAAFALPYLTRVRRASAAPATSKLIIMVTSNGVHTPQWNYTSALKPLEPFRSDIQVIRNLDLKVIRSLGHEYLCRAILTGWASPDGKSSGGISVDQHVAKFVRGQKRFASIQLAWPYLSGEVRRAMCFLGAGEQAVPFQFSPTNAIATLFAGVVPGGATVDPALDKARLMRLKLVDYIFVAAKPILPRLDGDGRQRIEEELNSWQAIQKRLQTPLTPSASRDIPASAALMPEILAKALACDLTRVATIFCGGYFDAAAAGTTRNHHTLSHRMYDTLSDAEQERLHGLITTWWATQFASFLGMLKQYKAEDGTSLLDSCAVLWTNEHSSLGSHGPKNMPYLLAGRAGGMRPGRDITLPAGTPHNNLLLSLCKVMGLPDTTFGNPEACTGPVEVL